jgi:hypothetical protein
VILDLLNLMIKIDETRGGSHDVLYGFMIFDEKRKDVVKVS